MKRFLTTILTILLATTPAIDNKNCFACKNSDSDDIPSTRYIFFNKKKNNGSKRESTIRCIEPRTYETNNIIANRTEKSLVTIEFPPTPQNPLYPKKYNIKKLNY